MNKLTVKVNLLNSSLDEWHENLIGMWLDSDVDLLDIDKYPTTKFYEDFSIPVAFHDIEDTVVILDQEDPAPPLPPRPSPPLLSTYDGSLPNGSN